MCWIKQFSSTILSFGYTRERETIVSSKGFWSFKTWQRQGCFGTWEGKKSRCWGLGREQFFRGFGLRSELRDELCPATWLQVLLCHEEYYSLTYCDGSEEGLFNE